MNARDLVLSCLEHLRRRQTIPHTVYLATTARTLTAPPMPCASGSRRCDPRDPAAAAAAIEVALIDPEARARGRESAALFTRKRAAEQTSVAYDRALNARS